MFNFLASQIPGPIFCTPASLGHASVTGMSIGNLQKILLHDIHNLLCDLILKHESTSPEFVWGFQCSLLGSKIHYLGQEKSNSLHGSTQVFITWVRFITWIRTILITFTLAHRKDLIPGGQGL